MHARKRWSMMGVLVVMMAIFGCRGSSRETAGPAPIDEAARRPAGQGSGPPVRSGSAETIVQTAAAVPNATTAAPAGQHRTANEAAPRENRDKPMKKSGATAEVVVLVHGMGRTTASMLPLKWALERDDYEVINFGYRSRWGTVREAGGALGERVAALEEERDGVRVHFVGHSLGNIVIRYLLAHHRPTNVGRVVMLAPPNQGSAKADQLESFSWILKPLSELTTDEQSTARSIPPPKDVEIGVIAGERDTKVTVEESHLEGEADHVVVPSGHTFIMARPKVHALVVQFLRTGRFEANRDEEEVDASVDRSPPRRRAPKTKSD